MIADNIHHKTIDAKKTLIQAMGIMDERFTKTLLVFSGGHFIGMITNGDLQRAIIAKIPFDTPVIEIVDNNKKRYARVGEDRESVRAWMLQKRAELMPVLDDQGELVDVVFWEDLFGDIPKIDERELNLPVVIMAGGKGTRLKPITNIIPKPLVPIGEKTILEEIMDRFEAIGCSKFYMSVNYKSDMMRFYLDQLEHKYNIEFYEEEKPLGTIGSVSLLKGKIDTPFFVSNCDIIIDQDMRDVYDYHCENHNDLTVIAAVKSFCIPYGVVETGEDGLMTALKEKPEVTYMINTGVYVLNPKCISEIPEGEFFHITQLMEKIKKRGGRVGCFPVSEHAWKDMGEWDEYMKMIRVGYLDKSYE